jgi:uroporphyrinogen decarboxylase
MVSRRAFLLSTAAAMSLRGAASMTSRERIDRILAGREPDRTPFTFWYHFRDETAPGAQHAQSTLDFHRRIGTDLVKVMSDYPYPKPAGEWFDLKVVDNPFPRQIDALRAVRESLKGEAHFVETIFNPYNVAEKLSSKEAVEKMRKDNPQRLLNALDVIAKSEANHARRAVQAGASGIFLAIANSADAEYSRFSEPFDKSVLQAAAAAPLNVLHIHGDKIDLPRFYQGWPAAAINYSVHGTRIPFAEARKHWSGVLMGGIDENNFRKLTASQVKQQADAARKEAGTKLIVAGGCSVPNDTTDEELLRAAGAVHRLSA